MKKTWLLSCLLLISGIGFAKHEIKYVISPLGNLVYQLDCMAQIAHFRCSNDAFIALWQEEQNTHDADAVFLAQWKSIRNNLDQNVTFIEAANVSLTTSPNFPMNEGNGLNVLEQVRVMAFAVESEKEYQRSLSYWLPKSHVDTELSVLKHFRPRFDAWFSQQKPTLDEFVTDAETLSKKVDVNSLLTAMREFYQSEIPEEMVLPVYLVAHPKSQAPTSGLVFNENSLIEVLKGEKAKNRLAVVIHEIAHFYHSRAPLDWHLKVMAQFTNSESKIGKVGYYLYNEGLAASIGNGLFESLAQDADYFKKYLNHPLSFYADEGIDRAAKAALPLVTSYINQKKSMDADFLLQLDQLWSSALADIKDAPKQRFRHVGMVIMDKKLDGLINELFGILRPSSAQFNTLSDGESLEGLALYKYPDLDAIILASDWQQLKPLKLGGIDSEQAEQGYQIKFNKQGAVRLVIVSESADFISQTVKNILSQKTFDEIRE